MRRPVMAVRRQMGRMAAAGGRCTNHAEGHLLGLGFAFLIWQCEACVAFLSGLRVLLQGVGGYRDIMASIQREIAARAAFTTNDSELARGVLTRALGTGTQARQASNI